MKHFRIYMIYIVALVASHVLFFIMLFCTRRYCLPSTIVMEMQHNPAKVRRRTSRPLTYDLWLSNSVYEGGEFYVDVTIDGTKKTYSFFISNGLYYRIECFLFGCKSVHHMNHVDQLVTSKIEHVDFMNHNARVQGTKLHIIEQLQGICWYVSTYPLQLFLLCWGILLNMFLVPLALVIVYVFFVEVFM